MVGSKHGEVESRLIPTEENKDDNVFVISPPLKKFENPLQIQAASVKLKPLTIISFVCAAMGLLLIFEVIRPFRDMSRDGPLAMILWGIGAVMAIIGFFVRPSAITLGVAALLANLIPLCGVGAVFVLLGHSALIWH